jgi:hypothetical protein
MPRPRSTGRKSNDARQILIRVNAAEYKAIVRAAKGLPLGMWARGVLLLAAGPHHHSRDTCVSLLRAMVEASSPNDMRADGWSVAVHNDYRLNGRPHTFWLLTRGFECVKGEAENDAAALDDIRRQLRMREQR